MLTSGRTDPHQIAAVIAAHPGDRTAIFAMLHASVGNSFAQQVMSALGKPQQDAAPSVLGFDGFDFDKPRIPTTKVPMTNEADLQAITARGDAEAKLKASGIDSWKAAKEALDIIIGVPESHRARVIDQLDPKAFDNLLERVPVADRERFRELVAVSQDPARKLRLWAEAHKSRAQNEVARKQGDIGEPIATWEDTDEDTGEVTEEIDDEEEEEIRKHLTKEQLLNRKRHLRRQATAASTKGEVDEEVRQLLANAKKTGTKLTMADVDALRDRKELEYDVEQKHNVNLTSYDTPRANGQKATWNKYELEKVDLTLSRLDHAKSPDSFSELRRKPTWHMMDGVGGLHLGDTIEITDAGASPGASYRHGGDKREMVSDELKREHGEKVAGIEVVLTHEIGHDVADKNKDTFEAFKKAAGWERVDAAAVKADGVDDAGLATLEAQRQSPTSKTSEIAGRTKIFSPISGTKDFWALPKTAVPAQDEAAPGPRNEDTWQYARVNPAEHFAEVYMKAVHFPEKLHDELVVRPTQAAEKAREKYDEIKRVVTSLTADKSARAQLRLANMRALLATLKADLDRAEAARRQRADQFALMRDSVFGTDKAVKISLGRLKAKQVSADKLEKFEERARVASTPEQVAFLEAEAMK